jgi:hypothetical protein
MAKTPRCILVPRDAARPHARHPKASSHVAMAELAHGRVGLACSRSCCAALATTLANTAAAIIVAASNRKYMDHSIA